MSIRRILGLLACLWLFWAPPAAAAETVTAKPALHQVKLTGFTRALAFLDLVAEEPGRVLAVAADVGQAIGQDGVFARIDPTFIQLDLEANRVQRAKLASRIAYDAKEARRYQELVARGTAPQSALDQLEQTLDAGRHELASLEVAGQVLAERLRRTNVAAPAGWLVTRRDVEPGQWVAAGQVLGRAGDFSTLLAPFALSPEQYRALRALGDSFAVALTDSGAQVRASVHRVNPSFDPDTRKIQVDLALDPGLADKRGGLRVLLSLPMPEENGAVLVPASAITERYEEHWVTRADGQEVRVMVLGGYQGGNGDRLVRVSGAGLRSGDEILARGRN